MDRAARRRGGRITSLPRVLLLALLALGIAGMHTYGHGGHGASGHDTTANNQPHGMLTSAGHDNSHAVRLIAEIGEPTTDGDTPLDLFSVCFAVLSAFGLALGLALLRTHSHRHRSVARTRLTVHRGGRGPPVPLLGLRVAAMSVLRI